MNKVSAVELAGVTGSMVASTHPRSCLVRAYDPWGLAQRRDDSGYKVSAEELAGAGRFAGRHPHIPAVNPYARMTHRSFESITIQKLPRNCRRLRRRGGPQCRVYYPATAPLVATDLRRPLRRNLTGYDSTTDF